MTEQTKERVIVDTVDAKHNEAFFAMLDESDRQIAAGNVIVKTLDELEAMTRRNDLNSPLREPFDYTERRARHLDTHTDVRELSRAAMEHAKDLSYA